jgi:hypothetical protein
MTEGRRDGETVGRRDKEGERGRKRKINIINLLY